MPVRTSESYQREVFEKYLKEKGGEMFGYLASPTRRQIREACIYLIDKRKAKYDEQTLDRFFRFSGDGNELSEIQKFDADKFRPIVNFLKGKVNRTSPENIELISWLIDFRPRPLKEYLDEGVFFPDQKFSNKNQDKDEGIAPVDENDGNESGTVESDKKWWEKTLKITISVAFGIVLLIFGLQRWYPDDTVKNPQGDECMTWADSLYVTVSCDTSPFSKYGTDVKPLDRNELKNMRKVEVNAAYPFFADDGSPLIWYYKNKEGEHEYFTAPGLHPVTGETLRKITPYIIQTYVPIHSEN